MGKSKDERDAFEEEMRQFNACDTEEFGRQKCSDKSIAILGDRWRPQTAKQDKGEMTCLNITHKKSKCWRSHYLE